MAKLVCQAGPDAGHEYPLGKDRTLFGRRSTCDVQIMDSMASREHFSLRRDGRLFTVVDHGSRNGTRVNDRRINERQLEFGDRLRVGEVEWLFVREEGDVDLRDLLTSKYEIIEKIGEGGMGIVYKACQRSMDRVVALKVLSPKYAARTGFVDRFIEEARAAGRLNHPNIIQVHDVDNENGINYFSMEFVDGATCMQLLRSKGRLGTGEALEIIRLIAKALQYAHDHRLIHRDVKPDNIMVGSNGIVKLADLGISKTFDEVAAEAVAGTAGRKVVGTPHYMAPEAASGSRIDGRSDIYSLGATLYHLLSGRTPFQGRSTTEVLRAHIKQDPQPIETLVEGLPRRVATLLRELMSRDPAGRPASAGEAVDCIAGILRDERLGSDLGGLGNDTVMLQRVAGGPTSPSASLPVPRATGGGTGGTATGRSPQAGWRDNMPYVRWAIIAVILGLATLLILQLGGIAFEHLRAIGVLEPRPTEDEVALEIVETVQQEPPADEQSRSPDRSEQARQLTRLHERLSSYIDDATLRDINARLDDIAGTPADASISEHVDRLREQLDRILAAQAQRSAQERLSRLREEISTLRDNHDYQTAMQRIDAFSVSASADHRAQLATERLRLQEELDALVAHLQLRIQQSVTRKDLPALRRLRNNDLPAPLAEHAVARELAEAIRSLEREHDTAAQRLLARARERLAAWDHEGLLEIHRQEREGLGEHPVGQQLDLLATRASELQQLIKDTANLVEAMERKPRYPGLLRGMDQPDLISARADGFVFRPREGGEVVVVWRLLDETAMAIITTQVFGDEAEPRLQTLRAIHALRDGG